MVLMFIFILVTGGTLLICLAILYAMTEVTKTYLTARDFTDFVGDVEAWVRSENG